MQRRRRHPLRRLRVGPIGRAAAWLVAFALTLQCVVDTGAALSMWLEMQGPGHMTQASCPEHHGSGTPEQRSTHDHEQCLVCNAAVGNCPEPILPQIAAAPDRSTPPAAVPETIAPRKVVDANPARAPPARA